MDMRWVSAVWFSPAEPRSARLDFFFLHTERLKCFMTAESHNLVAQLRDVKESRLRGKEECVFLFLLF